MRKIVNDINILFTCYNDMGKVFDKVKTAEERIKINERQVGLERKILKLFENIESINNGMKNNIHLNREHRMEVIKTDLAKMEKA